MTARKAKSTYTLRIVVLVVAILLVAAAVKLYTEVFISNIRSGANGKLLYIHTLATFDERYQSIVEAGVLKHPESFKRLLIISGYDNMLKPGRYKVSEGMNNLDLLRMMVSGRQEPFDVVLRYADRPETIAGFFGSRLEADSNEMLRLVYGPLVRDSAGLDSTHAVQFFIPDTYNFYWNTSAEKVMRRMLLTYRQFWQQRKLDLESSGLSIEEVGTLASIVQKETNKTDEMSDIAGVYINRLRLGMALQADPTLIYMMNDPSIRRVGGEMLKKESPYNTYIHTGLPPGPICMPDPRAIDAVLHYSRHHYLYFCAKADFSGYHSFAANLNAHLVNARNYQRALNRAGIK